MNDAVIRARVLNAVRQFCSRPGFIHTLDQARSGAGKLPPHRLSQLANSLAWHADRSHAPERLETAAAELARLWVRSGAGQDGESRLYLLLISKLGLDAELRTLQQQAQARQSELEHEIAGQPDPRQKRQRERDLRPQLRILHETVELSKGLCKALTHMSSSSDTTGPWIDQIGDLRELPAAQAALWRLELRLRLALAAVQSVQTLQQTLPLQVEVEQQVQQESKVFPWR